jgi:hypothetical protein
MREISITLSEGLNKGLRKDSKNPRNSDYLVEAYNVKCGRMGLQPYAPLSADLVTIGAVGKYTPQLFNTGYGTFLATELAVYPVYHDNVVGPAQYIDVVNLLAKYIKWSFVSFGGLTQYWCDGSFLYIGYSSVGSTGSFYTFDGKIHDMSSYGETTIDGYANILTIGGLGGRLFFTCLPWYQPLDLAHPDVEYSTQYRNIVLWSRAGSADDFARTGKGNELNSMINLLGNWDDVAIPGNFTDSDYTGIGLLAMPWYGTIECLKQLGNVMMVYGSPDFKYIPEIDDLGYTDRILPTIGGVGAMIQYTSPYPTFGYKHISDVGVARGRPVAGDENHHIYVDTDGVVWHLTSDLKKERLGYEEFIKPLLNTDYYNIFVSHDPTEDEFYISDGITCYLLGRSGLSRVYQSVKSIVAQSSLPVTSIVRSKQAIFGTNSADLSSVICTDSFDLGIRGIKTITGIEIGGYSTGTLSAAVDYKYNTNEGWTTSTYKTASRNGTVTPIVSGTDFRIRIKSSTSSDFDLDYIIVRAKLVDKRMVRGIYESKTVKATA